MATTRKQAPRAPEQPFLSTMKDTEEFQGQDLTAEIQKCRKQAEFWTKRQEKLEAKQRHEFLLQRIAEDPLSTWNDLPEAERTKEIVLAILACDPHFFGECPWAQGDSNTFDDIEDDAITLPDEFCEDRDVILAYAKGEHYEEVYEDFLEGAYGYEIPESVMDDKEVVLAICGKHWPCLQDASPTLQDDKDVVLATIGGPGWCACDALEYVSERLRGDLDVLSATVKSTVNDFSWLRHARFEGELEKKIAIAIGARLPELDEEFCYEDNVSPLPHFSNVVLDDEEIMSLFLSESGYYLKWCSERLRSDEKLVRAAVKINPAAVEHSLGEIRNNLMSNTEFMLSAIKVRYYGASGKLLVHAPKEMQQDKNIVLEAVANGLPHCNVPSSFRSDPEIALKALMRYDTKIKDLDDSVKVNKTFALEAVKADFTLYFKLPGSLQDDEQIALQTIKNAKDDAEGYTRIIPFVLEKVPSLLQSEEAMRIATQAKVCPFHSQEFCEVVQRSPFIGVKDFMVHACQNHCAYLHCASVRLRSDRDVVLAALSAFHRDECSQHRDFLSISGTFLLANVDVVVKFIDLLHVNNRERFLASVPAGVWLHRNVVLAWLERGWTILEHLKNQRSSLLDDQELVQMAIKNRWSEFQYAGAVLQEDRSFVLSIVKIDGRALRYAAAGLQRDYDLLTSAIVSNSATIAVCFNANDFDFLIAYATYVRGKLDLYENVFVREILREISTADHAAQSKLQMLDQGLETTIVFKRSIAEFLGAPIGEELHLLRAASKNLAKCGF